MKLIDFKEQYEKIKTGEFFLLLDGDQWLCCIGRNLANNRLMEYHNIFHSEELTDDYINLVFTREINATEHNNIHYIICSYDMFLAYNRLSIIKSFRKCISDSSNNFCAIREELSKVGGKCIKTETGTYAYLLGAYSSDEDYYYIYIDKDYNITSSSCVAKFGEVLNFVPNELKKFVNNTNEKVSQKLYDAIVKHFWNDCGVFFTPIYFNFTEEYTLKNLELMSIIFKN